MRSDYQSRCFALCLGFFGGFVLSGCELVEGVATVGWETAKFTGKAIKSAAYLAQGKHRVRLKKVGNSLFADVTLNRKTHAQFLVDTGASNVMLSQMTAKKLGINPQRGQPVNAKIAGGRIVPARLVTLREIRVGNARVSNIQAIVLLQETGGGYDGLLGMSFLNHFIFQVDTQKGELILQRRPE